MREQSPAIGDNGGPKANNWVAIDRDIRFHDIVGFLNPDGTVRAGVLVCETVAWLDLVMEANWKDRRAGNKGRVVLIERGQLMGARNWLAKRWGWSEKKVRWFLDRLKREGMISISSPNYDAIVANSKSGPATGPARGPAKSNSVNVITICNYNIYQTAQELELMLKGQQQGQQDGQRGASEGPHLNKETKEQKKEGSPDGLLPPDPQERAEDGAKMTASRAAREAFALYNETAVRCGLSVARALSDSRKRHLALRVKDAGGIDGFKQAMANLERSAWLQGRNDSGWRADLDFVCQPSSFMRLLEGGYGNGAHAMNKPARKSVDESWLDRQLAEHERNGGAR